MPPRKRRLLNPWLPALCVAAAFAMAATAWASDDFAATRDRVLEAIASHQDQAAAHLLSQWWQEQAAEPESAAALIAMQDAFGGNFQAARPAMAEEVAAHPGDQALRLGALVISLLEGNAGASRSALEGAMGAMPNNPYLIRRYGEFAAVQAATPAPTPVPHPLASEPDRLATKLLQAMASAPPMPVVLPTLAPVAPPTRSPVALPSKAPGALPTPAPIAVTAPLLRPMPAPVVVPTPVPVVLPTPASAPSWPTLSEATGSEPLWSTAVVTPPTLPPALPIPVEPVTAPAPINPPAVLSLPQPVQPSSQPTPLLTDNALPTPIPLAIPTLPPASEEALIPAVPTSPLREELLKRLDAAQKANSQGEISKPSPSPKLPVRPKPTPLPTVHPKPAIRMEALGPAPTRMVRPTAAPRLPVLVARTVPRPTSAPLAKTRPVRPVSKPTPRSTPRPTPSPEPLPTMAQAWGDEQGGPPPEPIPTPRPFPRQTPFPRSPWAKITRPVHKVPIKKPPRKVPPTPSPVLALLPRPLTPSRLSPWALPAPVPTAPPKRQVWIGESMAQLHRSLGWPIAKDGSGLERYQGLAVWVDPRTLKVTAYRIETAWYQGAWGTRPGLGLKTVLKLLPSCDGIFHLRPLMRAGTESIIVLASENGLIVQFERGDRDWLATRVEGRTPSGVMDYYQALKAEGEVKFIAPDYFFALEAKHRPLP